MAGAILAVSSGVSRFGGCVTIGPNVGVWKNPSEIESRDINKTEHFEQPNDQRHGPFQNERELGP